MMMSDIKVTSSSDESTKKKMIGEFNLVISRKSEVAEDLKNWKEKRDPLPLLGLF